MSDETTLDFRRADDLKGKVGSIRFSTAPSAIGFLGDGPFLATLIENEAARSAYTLALVDSDGKPIREVPLEGAVGSPCWLLASPDGEQVLLKVMGDRGYQILLLDLRAGGE